MIIQHGILSLNPRLRKLLTHLAMFKTTNSKERQALEELLPLDSKDEYTELYNLIEHIINKNCISRYRIDNIYMNRANLYMNYMNNLLHLEIFVIDMNRKTTGTWFIGCDHSCLELDIGLSSLTMKYNTNIHLIHTMLIDVRNIYHIGELQCIIINKLVGLVSLCPILLQNKGHFQD